jgi:hypothetical protein
MYNFTRFAAVAWVVSTAITKWYQAAGSLNTRDVTMEPTVVEILLSHTDKVWVVAVNSKPNILDAPAFDAINIPNLGAVDKKAGLSQQL